MKPTQKKPSSKYDSHCVVCKKPAHSPKGNYNARRVTLCNSVKCRHQRKIELQRARRAQKELFGKTELQSVISPDGKKRIAIEPSTRAQASSKASSGDNYQANGVRPFAAKSRPQRDHAGQNNSRIAFLIKKKPHHEKLVIGL